MRVCLCNRSIPIARAHKPIFIHPSVSSSTLYTAQRAGMWCIYVRYARALCARPAAAASFALLLADCAERAGGSLAGAKRKEIIIQLRRAQRLEALHRTLCIIPSSPRWQLRAASACDISNSDRDSQRNGASTVFSLHSAFCHAQLRLPITNRVRLYGRRASLAEQQQQSAGTA